MTLTMAKTGQDAPASETELWGAVSHLCHDVTDSLNAVGLFLQLERGRGTGEPADGELQLQISAAFQDANSDLQALQILSRLCAGSYSPRTEPMPLQAILNDVRDYARNTGQAARQIRFNESTATAQCDPLLTRILAVALLKIALDHDPARILVGVRRRGGTYIIQFWYSALRRQGAEGLAAETGAAQTHGIIARYLAERTGARIGDRRASETHAIVELALPTTPQVVGA